MGTSKKKGRFREVFFLIRNRIVSGKLLFIYLLFYFYFLFHSSFEEIAIFGSFYPQGSKLWAMVLVRRQNGIICSFCGNFVKITIFNKSIKKVIKCKY